jgi:mono/diheme cytochrome c family protein
MNKLTLVLTTIFILLLATGRVLADESGMPQGQVVYEHWCAPCHAEGMEHPGTMALEAKYKGQIPAVLINRGDLTPEFVKQFVRNGVSIMPFFRKTEISDKELDSLANYIAEYSKNK